MMHWILQNNLFNEEAYQTLLDTLIKFDIPYSIHKVIPFIGKVTPKPKIQSKQVICMGSYSMRHSARKHGWLPGVFDLEPFNFTEQLKHWGEHMLNADSQIVPFAEVIMPEIAFVRPIEDSKVFAGKIFEQKEFNDWQKKVCVLEEDFGSSLTKDTLVQVCHPKMIYAEYRFWIVKGQIVTASLYKRGSRVIYSSDVDQQYFDFVRERIAEWQPLETFVIDVCSIPSEDSDKPETKIVEINTLNSAGFYACDIQKLVMALEDAYNG